MNIDITKLKCGNVNELEINETYSFSKDELSDTDIISLDNMKVNGYITCNMDDLYDIDVVVDGTMVLPCSLTLKPVNYDFSIKIDGNIEEFLQEINESSKKTQNTIDILPIIWENILMEIPIRVISEDANNLELQGDGWKVITEEDDGEELNPELQKLKDLFNEK